MNILLKKAEKTFEFSDFEHFAVKLLIDEKGNRTSVADNLQQKYVKIMEEQRILLTIHEGRFHQVKRMLKAVGNEVISLKRIKFGSLKLDPSLRPGDFRELTAEEINNLLTANK